MWKTAQSGQNYIFFQYGLKEEKSLFLYTTFQKCSASSIFFLPGCSAKVIVLPLLHTRRFVTQKQIDLGTFLEA